MTDDRHRETESTNGTLPASLATSGGGLERRRVHRVAWEHHEASPVALEVQEPGEAWRPVDCTVVDLGAGGMGLLVPEPLAPGARIRITLVLPPQLGREPYADEDTEPILARWI